LVNGLLVNQESAPGQTWQRELMIAAVVLTTTTCLFY